MMWAIGVAAVALITQWASHGRALGIFIACADGGGQLMTLLLAPVAMINNAIHYDPIALAFWLNGSDSAGCCAFRGGPFLESRFFGEGVGIAVKRGNDLLRLSLNWALFRLWEKGSFTDLWLRYFPINPF